MLLTAIAIFTVAALGGLILASFVLRDKLAPWVISMLHAALGACGLATMVFLILEGTYGQQLLISFAFLLLAALGGFFLASFHMRDKVPPKAIVFLHAGLAVVGFLILVSLAL